MEMVLGRFRVLIFILGCQLCLWDVALAEVGTKWTTQAINSILRLQNDSKCFASPAHDRHVHVLGVEVPDGLDVKRPDQTEIVNALVRDIAAETTNRVTTAKVIHSIATRSASISEEAIKKLQDSLKDADRADITVVVRPYDMFGKRLATEIIVWTQDPTRENEIRCTRSISIEIELARPSDPACEAAWTKARKADSVDAYRGFIELLDHCPQRDEAETRLDELKRVECSENWSAVSSSRNHDLYRQFAIRHPHCQERKVAEALANQPVPVA